MGDPSAGAGPDEPPEDSAPDVSARQWDAVYAGMPPWEIGRAQPGFVALADAGRLRGRLLDVGCGTGETTLLAAAHGADALGVDLSRRAVQLARAKASRRGVPARFAVADVLHLDQLREPDRPSEPFDTVVDSGTFHLFDAGQRAGYLAGLGAAIRPGGTYYLLCARAGRPGPRWGPPGLSIEELGRTFRGGWAIAGVEPARYEVTDAAPVEHVEAWLATVIRQ